MAGTESPYNDTRRKRWDNETVQLPGPSTSGEGPCWGCWASHLLLTKAVPAKGGPWKSSSCTEEGSTALLQSASKRGDHRRWVACLKGTHAPGTLIHRCALQQYLTIHTVMADPKIRSLKGEGKKLERATVNHPIFHNVQGLWGGEGNPC